MQRGFSIAAAAAGMAQYFQQQAAGVAGGMGAAAAAAAGVGSGGAGKHPPGSAAHLAELSQRSGIYWPGFQGLVANPMAWRDRLTSSKFRNNNEIVN